MIVIATFVNCQIIQEVAGDRYAYRVMSKNNICLYQSALPAKAMAYAEWFERKAA